MKEREEIKLSAFQHHWLIWEHELVIGGGAEDGDSDEGSVDWDSTDRQEFKFIESENIGSNRRSHLFRIILQRKSDGKYFETGNAEFHSYLADLRDTQYNCDINLKEVFPKIIETTIYE